MIQLTQENHWLRKPAAALNEKEKSQAQVGQVKREACKKAAPNVSGGTGICA